VTEVRRFNDGIMVVRRATDEGAQVLTFVSFWDLLPMETRSSPPPPSLGLSSTALVRCPAHRGRRGSVSSTGSAAPQEEERTATDVKKDEQPEQKENIA